MFTYYKYVSTCNLRITYPHLCLTQDGDLAGNSRWSCALSLGGPDDDCIISYDMGTIRELTAVRLGKIIRKKCSELVHGYAHHSFRHVLTRRPGALR